MHFVLRCLARLTMTSSAVDIPKTVGALLVGGLFASVLFGFSNLQALFYFRSYQDDPLRLKLLVAFVWVMDTIHIGFLWGGLWFYLITSDGMPAAIDQIPTVLMVVIFTNTVIGVCKDCFFGYRVFMLSKRNWCLTTLIVILLCLRLVSAILTSNKMSVLITLTFAAPAGMDAFTTGALVYLLRQHRLEHGRLNHILDRLLLYGVETASFTFCGSITTALCWLLMKDNFIFAGVFCCMGKFYTNMLFAR
ncbi:hypothetical protein FB45DRAFT_1032993 [Roridomyces roridus]|uniref:DUF6534 domain-containing protein n=1 Tax=Roridomyces roridus TaxID=1738132 RepID=A0AAD7FF33_9AGAR|nr:hypothetical protein FB45DRAFT_1032993 [Roridomyces roridus]